MNVRYSYLSKDSFSQDFLELFNYGYSLAGNRLSLKGEMLCRHRRKL
jgi:hypothetical protein